MDDLVRLDILARWDHQHYGDHLAATGHAEQSDLRAEDVAHHAYYDCLAGGRRSDELLWQDVCSCSLVGIDCRHTPRVPLHRLRGGIFLPGPRPKCHDVFFDRSFPSGWESQNLYVGWHLGLLTCLWSFTGFDDSCHLSEETKQAPQAVPRATFWSITVNGILAFIMVIAILSAMGPIEDVLASGFPVATILLDITGSAKATTAMVCGLFIISFCVCTACLASVSRLTWAWARDGGLPRWFALIDPTHHIPVRSVWLSLVVVALLSLLNIGSAAAFGAITALSSLGLYFSYAMAILSMLLARRAAATGAKGLDLGEWTLGRAGIFINCFALTYTLYMMVFLPIPYTLPVTAQNMNWAGPIFLGTFLIAVGLWFGYARKNWPGPSMAVLEYVRAHG